MPTNEDLEKAAEQIREFLADAPDIFTLEDVRRHSWLRHLAVVCDDVSNRVAYRALEHAKMQDW